jgi:hypothetical protein
MTRRVHENIVTGALLVVFGGIVYLCQDFGPRARMIPLPLAIFGIVLTVIQILWQNLRSTDELQMDLIHVRKEAFAPAPDAPAQPAQSGSTFARELRAYAIVAALVGLVLVVGIIPAVFVFTAGYFVLTRHYSWLMGLVYTSAFTASVYLLFVAALQIEPYYGLLAPVVERFR